MEKTSSKPSDLMSEKKNRLRQIWLNLKQSIFDVLFVVLDKAIGQAHDVTIMSLFKESGFDYIQMMQFPFNFTIIMVWNGGETLNNIFKLLTTVLSINALLPGLNYTAFLIFLYLVIFSIVLIIIDIVYVSYSFNKKKFRFTLPLVLLAQIVPLFVTFLFIPVFQILLNIINCNPSKTDPSIQVLTLFPNVQCFRGMHMIHSSITLFFTAIFVFISTVVAMTLFQPRMTANTIVSRRSSDGQIIFIVNKIICQFFFSFTPFEQKWPYILLMFLPALWLFYFYQFKQPYYDKNVGKLYRIFSSYYFWTVLMLTISQLALLFKFNFQGSMVIWFCGLPFIAISIAYESKSNIDNLFSSNLKYKTGEELESHLNYVLQLINNREKDANANMLLVGYIEKHIETCVEDDCPIKMKKLKKQAQLPEMDENCNLLIIQIERMFKQGIKKFPSSTKLHISFAFFYMERQHNQTKAYQEFLLAEKLSPTFVQEFIIYRFKKIIKDKLEDESNKQSDLIEVIRFDNHVTLCEEAMLTSAKLHKQFWSELVEQTPNLQKLNETGSKIIDVVNNVKFNYIEVNKINKHSPEIIHNYGVYSMFVSQSITEGKLCLSQAKKAYFQKISKADLLPGVENSQEDSDQKFSMLVSAQEQSLGKILAVNDSFVQLSGYLKEEITEKPIDKILPQVMIFCHEYAINNWIKDSSRIFMSDQRNSYFREVHRGFIKQKSGFIMPVQYRVKYKVFEEKFAVYFKNERELGQDLALKIYIITDNRGVIRQISSLGFAYFNLTKDNLAAADRFIDQFGISFNQDLYAPQGHYAHILKRPLFKEQEEHKELTQEAIQEEGEKFLIQAEKLMMPFHAEEEDQSEINSAFIKNGKKDVGTILKLERVVQQTHHEGQIKFDALENFGKDILDLYQVDHEDIFEKDEESPLMDRGGKKSQVKESIMKMKHAEVESYKERIFKSYAGRIRTYRLVNHELKRLVEGYEDTSNSQDEIDEEKAAMSAFEMDKLKKPLFVEKIKSAINTNIDHGEVTLLKITFFLFLCCLITIISLNYIEINSQFSTMEEYMQDNTQWVKDLYFLNNLFHLYLNTTNTKDSFAANLKYTLSYNITFDPDVSVWMEDTDGSTNKMALNQAMIWVQGSMVNLFQSALLGVNQDLLLKNYYMKVYPALQNYKAPFQVTYTPSLIYLLAIASVSITTILIWIYSSMKIDIKCGDIILWFLDIPVAYVSYLYSNCSTFIKSYVNVKQLIDKGINFYDKNLYLDEFRTESDKEQENDKFNQDNKVRKTMIARYKKKTFLSHCECGYLQLFWLLLYSLAFSVGYIFALNKQVSFYQFINRQWQIKAKQLLWSCTIPNNLQLMFDHNYTQIGSINLLQFQKSLENNFLNPTSTQNLNQQYLQLLNYGGNITGYFLHVFKGDICEFPEYSYDQSVLCKSFLSGKLEGGISAVFTYYTLMDYTKYVQVGHTQYDYVNRYLLQLFDVWGKGFKDSVSGMGSTLVICLSLYILLSVVGFILFWALYLRKLNMRLNQTIQMLNMIPMRMLPRGRRDIADFFNWIIQQANSSKVQT